MKNEFSNQRLRKYNPAAIPSPLTSLKAYVIKLILIFPLLGVGVWFLGMYFQFFPVTGRVNVPMEVLGLIGLLFCSGSLIAFIKTGGHVLASLRAQNRKKMHPDSPWRWDNEWNSKGEIKEGWKRLFINLIGLIFVILFFTPFYIMLLNDKDTPTMALVIVIVMSSIFTLIAIYRLLKSLKYKNVKCLFQEFPFRLGQEASVVIYGLPNIEDTKSIKLELRCLESRLETIRRNNKSETKRNYYEFYKTSIEVDLHDVHNGQYQVNIPLPSDASLTTDFTLEDYHFWELRVIADTKGIDYNFGFLLPIYL